MTQRIKTQNMYLLSPQLNHKWNIGPRYGDSSSVNTPLSLRVILSNKLQFVATTLMLKYIPLTNKYVNKIEIKMNINNRKK